MEGCQVFIFGHSMVLGKGAEGIGWAEMLKEDCMGKSFSEDREFEAYPLGVANEDSRGLKKRLENEIEARSFKGSDKLVILQTGLNDTQFFRDSMEFRVPKREFIRNMSDIIEKAEDYGKAVVVSDGYTSLEGEIPGEDSVEASDKVLADYVYGLEQLCREKGVPFVNLRKEFSKSDWCKHLVDCFHPDRNMHKRIFTQVEEFVGRNNLLDL